MKEDTMGIIKYFQLSDNILLLVLYIYTTYKDVIRGKFIILNTNENEWAKNLSQKVRKENPWILNQRK